MLSALKGIRKYTKKHLEMTEKQKKKMTDTEAIKQVIVQVATEPRLQ